MGAFTKHRDILIPDDEQPEEAAAFRKEWGWEPHEQVRLRGSIIAGIQEKIGNLSDQQGTASLVTLQEMIVGWTFTDEAGHAMEPSLENIRLLNANYLTPLSMKVGELQMKGMDEAAQQRFLATLKGLSGAK